MKSAISSIEPIESLLELPLLQYPVYLGCHKEERMEHQTVLFHVMIFFSGKLPGIETDQLEDTVCYAQIAETLHQVCSLKEYHLIENLAGSCLIALENKIRQWKKSPELKIKIKVIVSKQKPPAPHFNGPALFHLQSGEWL